MRNSTKNIVSALGLGTLAMSYVIGMNSTTANGYTASGLGGGGVATTPATDGSISASANPTASVSASASASASTGSATKPSAAPSASSTKKSSSGTSSSSGSSSGSSSSGSSSSGSSSAGSAAVTKSGGAIKYQFGTVQVSVTKTGGKITAIDYVQATATHGRDAAFNPLVQAAIGAQGSNFGNLSGATYTTDAFRQALDSALSKF